MTARTKRDAGEQHERFIEAARALGCDEDEARFNAALGKVARQKPTPRAPKEPKPARSKTAK